MTLKALMLLVSLLSSGLIAGLFFGWSVSVIPGTARIDDRAYVTTMQSINREIINPVFVASFILPPFLLAGAAVLHFRDGQTRRGVALGMAAATYVLGVMAVTIGGNVPLNDALETFDLDAATDPEVAERRTSYETTWNRWHTLRTVASVVAFSLTAIACTLTDAD